MRTLKKHKHKFLLLAVIAVSVSSYAYFSDYSPVSANDFTWVKRSVYSLGSRNWTSIASSADGMKLVATANNNYMYTSADGGDTWTKQIGSGVRSWKSVTSSSDGTKIAATVAPGYIYTSSDSGVTWTERTSAGQKQWYSITSSPDGATLAAVDNGGYVFRSIDSGSSWTQMSGAGPINWNGVASAPAASGGNTIFTINGAPNGRIYSSTNGGALAVLNNSPANTYGWRYITASADGNHLAAISVNSAGTSDIYVHNEGVDIYWTKVTSPAGKNFVGITSSSDGKYIAAIVASGNVYGSSDYGATWSLKTNAGSRAWTSIAYTPDGSKLLAGISPGNIFSSPDKGATWTELYGSGGDPVRPLSIDASDDGSKIILGADQDYLYTSTDSGVTWLPRGTVKQPWYRVISSGTGAYLNATGGAGDIYRSSNTGVTWTLNTDADVKGKAFGPITSSSGGNKVVMGPMIGTSGAALISADYGYTWTPRAVAGASNSAAIASSADGNIIVNVSGMSTVFVSTNSGVNWSNFAISGAQFTGVAMSSSGSIIYLFDEQNNKVYKSIDTGSTWRAITVDPAGMEGWSGNKKSIVVSSDGNRLAVAKSSGYIYTSTNGGGKWTKQTAAGKQSWIDLALSADGTKLIAATTWRDVYVGTMNATNGICGSNNGGEIRSLPVDNAYLCDEGTATAFTYSTGASGGKINWTCPGIGAGASTASCSAKDYTPARGFTVTSSSFTTCGQGYSAPGLAVSTPSPTKIYQLGEGFNVSGSTSYIACGNNPAIVTVYLSDEYGKHGLQQSLDGTNHGGSTTWGNYSSTFSFGNASVPAIAGTTTPGKHRFNVTVTYGNGCGSGQTSGYQEYTVAQGGLCGSAKDGKFTSPPTTNLCSGGSATAVTLSGGKYNWTCQGIYGTDDPCSADFFAGPTCGSSASTTPVASAPTTNLCVNGTASAVTQDVSGTNYQWTCSDGNVATDQSCSVPILPPPVPGACGPAAKTYTFTETFPNGNYCGASNTLVGSIPSSPTSGGSTSWLCKGNNNGTTVSCSASRSTGSVGGGSPVTLNTLVVTPLVPSGGTCSVNIMNTIRSYLYPATGETDPHSYCELRNQYDSSPLYIFNSAISGYANPIYPQTGVTRDTLYTFSCWDVINGATTTVPAAARKTGICRVNIGTIETN